MKAEQQSWHNCGTSSGSDNNLQFKLLFCWVDKYGELWSAAGSLARDAS